QGLEKITGPENYTVSESCGILTEGFDRPPVIGMPYNKPYYRKLLEGFDMQTAMKLVAYQINSGEIAHHTVRSKNIFKYRLSKEGITIRSFNMKDFNAEVDKFHKIYNDSFSENWGFVPLTREEFRYQAAGLKSVAVPDLVLFAEKDNELIGFITTLPDYNQVFKQIKRGRLLPFGWLKMLRAKKDIDCVRISIMGIKKEFRKSGVGAIFYARIFEQANRKNLFYGEGSYVMENNEAMQKSIEFLGGRIYKRYRIYEKRLD
ncbi:MAG: GNAT family N-acetyltransferase, partial [Candidatus Pacearchaeota archaeon]|nr:GNAT family N-acetyltransferase [Candidatus Pacearchaeota archaeon]